MAISIHVGLTKSGKSWNVQKRVLPKFAKVIVYDSAECFDEGDIFRDPHVEDLKRIFTNYKNKKEFKIIIRPSRTTNEEYLCNRVILLASALGQCVGKNAKECVQLVIDEADFICSSSYQSEELKFIVNKGRHDNVDTHFIARNPTRLHTDIRSNATKITTFSLTNALDIPFLVSNLSRDICRKIQKLPKFHRCEWDTTGKIEFFTDKNKKYEIKGEL